MDRVRGFAAFPDLCTRESDVDEALNIERFVNYPKYLVYLVASAIFVVTLYNIVFTLFNRLCQENSVTRNTCGEDGESMVSSDQLHAAGALVRLPCALVNAARIVLCRVSIQLFPGLRFTVIEVIICTLYLFVLLFFEFVNARNTVGMLDVEYWADRAAVLAVSQFALIVALSGKNNLISPLTGIGYEKLNVFHRAFSRSALVLIWIHMWGRWKIGFNGEYGLYHGWVRTGILASTSFTLMVILGTRQFRVIAYEFFLGSHMMLTAIFLVAACVHVANARPYYLPYIWSACVFWAFDRSLRLARVFRIRRLVVKSGASGYATVIALSKDVVEVTLRSVRSPKLQYTFGWMPGQNAYLSIPSVSKWGSYFSTEAHPFSIASIDDPVLDEENDAFPDDGETQNTKTTLIIKFIVRVREGFTRRLYERTVLAGGTYNVSAYVDGPYGSPPAVYSYPNVILVAGGTGVSFTLPLLLDLVRRSRNESSPTICKKVKFVLYVRQKVHFKIIAKEINAIATNPPTNMLVEIVVFVTTEHADNADLDARSLHSNTEKQVETEAPAGSGEPSTVASKEHFDVETALPTLDGESGASIAEVERSGTVRVEYSKQRVANILREEVPQCRNSVAICVSGPQTLIGDVREALRDPAITGPLAILRGGPSVFLHAEQFGM